jgi:hypothetical protein
MLVQAQTSSPMIVTGTSGLAAWKALSRNLDQRLEKFAKEPVIARQIAYFRDKIGGITTAEALVKDQRLYEFAILAYDLEGQENAQGLMKRVLASDLSVASSPANRMSDEKYRTITRDFAFAGGTSSDQKTIDKVVQAYVRAEYEARHDVELPTVTTDEQDEALADLAKESGVAAEIAYFKKAITSVASSEEVAKDKRLVAFARKAAGFTDSLAYDSDFIEQALDDGTVRDGLSDERWDKFADIFAAARAGRKLRSDGIAAKVDAVVERWVEASFTLETGRHVVEPASDQLKADLAAYAARSDVKAKIDEFRTQIAGVTSSASLVAKVPAYNFVLRAYGLEAYKKNPDLVLRALGEPVTSRTSPAAQDKRFKEMALGLSFIGRSSMPATSDEAFVDAVVEKYVRVQFERAVGGTDINLRHALYAQRRLPEVTSAYQITGDTALRKFVFPTVGLSPDSTQDVDRLATTVKQKVEMGRLGDAAYLDKLTRRFFAQSASTSSGTGTATPASAALTILSGGTLDSGSGISLDLLLQLQSR